ncbi:MAG: ribonuclease III [Clostridiales bacterium]|nr:ribonuclease III [Clostridiales bacterium]
MEKSLIAKLKIEFNCKEVDIKEYSPLALAYIGDSIYDVIVRTVVVERGNRSANNLHKMAVKYVNAATQAAMADALQEYLTEEELAVYKRGRNAKSYTKAKNATMHDYRKATGLEALFGYLYLRDEMDRVIELIKVSLHKIQTDL